MWAVKVIPTVGLTWAVAGLRSVLGFTLGPHLSSSGLTRGPRDVDGRIKSDHDNRSGSFAR
jgi:hypothetical protein